MAPVFKGPTGLLLALIIVLFFVGLVYYATHTNLDQPQPDQFVTPTLRTGPSFSFQNLQPAAIISSISSLGQSFECKDPVWCTIEPPKQSYFRFPTPPDDPVRWKKAQFLASTDDHILLQSIIKYFPNNKDFLDGDILFRRYHEVADFFLDDNYDFDVVNSKIPFDEYIKQSKAKGYKYSWEKDPSEPRVIPEVNEDLRSLNRAPILHLGYFAFSRKGRTPFFGGPQIGEAIVDKNKMLKMWKAKAKSIDVPWIGLHAANENWGMLSTLFPNRTIDWGKCCTDPQSAVMLDLLNHDKTVMFLTNQHHNLTHPKLLSVPRGVPLHTTHASRLLHDSMLKLLRHKELLPSKSLSKANLLFTSSSTWGYRPVISACIAKKFAQEVTVKFQAYNAHLKGRFTPTEYYELLGVSKFSVALPGLGYDTFRLWEALTLGTIPVLEKGIGLDKALWKLPALLVDDFDEITPALLRQAYVEALYRVEEFEFQRLTQSFWWHFIMNVSMSQNSARILDFFPLESEDPHFTRPFVPYECGKTNSCGVGTKRTPKSYC